MTDSARAQNPELIWQIAVVRHAPDGAQLLEFSDPAACAPCSQGTGCGAALFSRLFAGNQALLPLGRDEPLRAEGEVVRVGLDPRWLLLAAAANYLLPVAAFVAGAVIAGSIWPRSDPAALAGGLLTMFVVWALLRPWLKSVREPRLRLIDVAKALESSVQRDHISKHYR